MFRFVLILKPVHIATIIKVSLFITFLSISVTSQQVVVDQGSFKNIMWNATYTDLLKRDLFAHYDKFARPTHHSNITTVKIDLMFKHIVLDDTKFIMTVNAWIIMHWQDEKLKWNNTEYGGLKFLPVADHEIWQPDVVIFDSAVGSSIDHYGNVHLILWSSGEVLWVPPCQFQVFCEMDLTKWPYDKHSCNLPFTSWTYAGDSINLTVKEPTLKTTEDLVQDAFGWNVISITAEQVIMHFTCCDEPYYKVVYTVTLERAYSAYTIIVFAPAIGVMLLSLCIFWLPPNSSNKFILGGINALIHAVFLVYLLQRLATFGRNTPLIVTFYAYSIILNGISMIECLFSYKIATKHYFKAVPWILKKIIRSKIVIILLFPNHQIGLINQRSRGPIERSKLDEDRENLTYIGCTTKRSESTDWIVVATALDRVMFFLTLVFYICFITRSVL